MNAGRPPRCSVSCRMSGVFGQKFGLRYSREEEEKSSSKYSVISCFVLRQVKYVYDCVKPSFASLCMTRGRVKASDKKTNSGNLFFRSRIAQSQNSKIDLSSSHSDCHAGVSKSNG